MLVEAISVFVVPSTSAPNTPQVKIIQVFRICYLLFVICDYCCFALVEFTHIVQAYLNIIGANTKVIVWLSQRQWRNLDKYVIYMYPK